MSGNYPPGQSAPSVGQRIEEAVELIEMELRHAIAYVNDAVIPQVRRESISAMRTAAETLRNLADRFEQRDKQSAQNHTPPQNQTKEPRP
jgi:predicted double-glycine peptidase